MPDNTREEPEENKVDEDIKEGEKDPKDSEKFLFGPLLNVLTSLTGKGGHGHGHGGGLGGLGGFGGHHGYPHPPPYGYPPYGPQGSFGYPPYRPYGYF